MFVDCYYCKRASWKIGLESNELPSLNKEFTYFYLLIFKNLQNLYKGITSCVKVHGCKPE